MVDAAHRPGDRREALGSDPRAADIAGPVGPLSQLLQRALDVAELRVEPLRRVDLGNALHGLRRALADALAERHGAHRIAGRGGERRELVPELVAGAFERVPNPCGIHGGQTPSRSGSPPDSSTWPSPSPDAKIVGAARDRRDSSSLKTSVAWSTHSTTRSPGRDRSSALRAASISSSTISALPARAPVAIASRTPSRIIAAVSPRLRPRGLRSSRMITSSK